MGATTPEGDLTHWRPLTVTGPPGEVTNSQLNTAIAGTARNPASVAPLSLTVSNPPTQAEVQTVVDKINELIAGTTR